MIKKLGVFLLLLLSIALLFIGGAYVYKKQTYKITFSTFDSIENNTVLYIPDLTQFNQLKLTNIHYQSFELPKVIINSASELLSIIIENNNESELYLSYNKELFIAIIKQNGDELIDYLSLIKKQKESQHLPESNCITIQKNKYYYYSNDTYFALSNKEISLNQKNKFKKPLGNYHYYIKKENDSDLEFFKHNSTEELSFKTITSDTVIGKAVSPESYFKIIPSNFDSLFFYGSNRFSKDIKTLLKTKTKSDFYSWINHSMLHLKKDSMELIIGLKNDFIDMGDLLDEQTLGLSNDSLLPTSLYKNNTEIHFFNSNYDWKSIIPRSQSDFKIYAELNNFNVIANSTQSMYWLITQLQLGNIFYKASTNLSIPKKINQLTVIKKDSSYQLSLKKWITETKCFQAQIESSNISVDNQHNVKLNSTFSISITPHQILAYQLNDSLHTLIYNDTILVSYNKYGQKNWVKKLKTPLIQPPTLLIKDSSLSIILIMKNQIDAINHHNHSLRGFPLKMKQNEEIEKANVIKNTIKFNIIITTSSKILNINHLGKFSENWKVKTLSSPLKSKLFYSKKNNIIYFSDTNDSLSILNYNGNTILSYKLKNKAKLSSMQVYKNNENNSYSLLDFSKPYIMNYFLQNNQVDSINIDHKITPIKTKWTETKAQQNLEIETYNRVLTYNKFGTLENEIQKPQPNVQLLSNQTTINDVIVFGNLNNKELYLLDSFGKRIIDKPILGESIFTIINSNLIVIYNSMIYIYTIKKN